MIIIVGLGNPGEKFETTRHNAGFMALDFFAKKNGFPEFEFSKKYASLISKKDDILLAKPQTFMNESGKAVKKLVTNSEGQVIIVHDESDLALGTLKIVKERGSAGHKGVESIIQNIGNENLARLRIGIQSEAGKALNTENWVIKKFTPEEMQIIENQLPTIADALSLFITEGLEKAMNKFN